MSSNRGLSIWLAVLGFVVGLLGLVFSRPNELEAAQIETDDPSLAEGA
ncbi:MAG: hypothetical protein ACR2IE_14270 [Candidatus Sumerlaeaceae bacterium]